MRILFVLDNLSSNCGANVGIVYEIIKQWKKENIEMCCLTREDKYHELDEKKVSLLDGVWSFKVTEDDVINDFTKKDIWLNASKFKRIILLLTHPRALFYMINKKYFESSIIEREYERQISKICGEESFDVVFAVAEPFYIAEALSHVGTEENKYTIMMDPYTNSFGTTSRSRDRKYKKEMRMFASSKKVFTLDFVGKDMDYLPTEYRSKVVQFYVPKIHIDENRDVVGITTDEMSKQESNEDENVNFVYVGLLYEDIRSPEFMFSIFEKLPENYRLHFYGGGADRIVNRYKPLLGDKLVCHGWVGNEEAREATNDADVLINLNNSIINMLPSKLLDYIDSGKPILNICQIEKCPSLEYMKDYPMGYNVVPGDDVSKIVEDVKIFVKECKGKRISHQLIENLYKECTNEYVSKLIFDVIKEK